jgi:hypothetical protein
MSLRMKHQPPQVPERFSACRVAEVLISAITARQPLEELVGRREEREEAKRTEADDFLSTLPELLRRCGERGENRNRSPPT